MSKFQQLRAVTLFNLAWTVFAVVNGQTTPLLQWAHNVGNGYVCGLHIGTSGVKCFADQDSVCQADRIGAEFEQAEEKL